MKQKMHFMLPILQIVSLILICSIIIYQFSMLINTANKVKYQQTEKFAYSLTNRAAAEATRYLSNKSEADLQQLVDDLSDDPIVRDATVYNELGQILYQSKNVLPLKSLLKIDSQEEQYAQGVIPYIAELYNENKKIGYIRVSLEQQKILALIDDYQEKSASTMLLLLILSFMAGIILMALFFNKLKDIYYSIAKTLYVLLQQNRMYW